MLSQLRARLQVRSCAAWRETTSASRVWMSTRQAERLRRPQSHSQTSSATVTRPSASTKSSSRLSYRSDKVESKADRQSRWPDRSNGGGGGSGTSATGRRQPFVAAKAASKASSGSSVTSFAVSSTRPPVRGRFNRLVLERGVFFTVYLYVLAESFTMTLTYLLHSHYLGVGDVGSWLEAVHVPADAYLNRGPFFYGLQLSPRLLLNYAVASVCTHPLLPTQMRFVTATAPLLKTPFQLVGGLVKRRGAAAAAVPKAPAAKMD